MPTRRDVYDAPETAAGIVSPAGDVWSIGVTLVAALTENVSFDGEGATRSRSTGLFHHRCGIARECLHLDPKRRCSLGKFRRGCSLRLARCRPTRSPIPSSSPGDAWPRGRCTSGGRDTGRLGHLLRSRKSVPAPATAASEQPASQPPPPSHETAATPAPAPTAKPVVPVEAPPPKSTATSGGGVLHQVLPEVSQGARNTITGTVKVGVRFDVNSSGKVTAAKFASAGRSQYFAGLAMKAAQRWEFTPPQVNGTPAASAWLLQFRFRRSSTEAVPQRVSR